MKMLQQGEKQNPAFRSLLSKIRQAGVNQRPMLTVPMEDPDTRECYGGSVLFLCSKSEEMLAVDVHYENTPFENAEIEITYCKDGTPEGKKRWYLKHDEMFPNDLNEILNQVGYQ